MQHGSFNYKQLQRFNVPGHLHFLTFSCHNRLPLLSNEVARTRLGACVASACNKENWSLWAYVFMPEHVHLLVHPKDEKCNVSQLMYWMKKPFAEQTLKDLKQRRSSKLLEKLSIKNEAGVAYRVWMAGGGFDTNLWTWEKIIQKAEYCHKNPVKRGLVKRMEHWRWSSVRWLEHGARENEPLKIDDWLT